MSLTIRPQVRRFAEEMERRLRANDHKGGWSQCPDKYLIERLGQEAEELYCCRPERITEEAADVANFAMMIADNFGGLMKEKP